MTIQEIKDANDIIAVVEREGVMLTKKRGVYQGLCPLHKEDTPSFTVNEDTQRFKCYGCGQKGDVIDFIAALYGTNLKDAMARLSNSLPTEHRPAKPSTRQKARKWVPCPDGSSWDDPVHYHLGRPSRVWAYRGVAGEVIAHVGRFDLPDGSKEVLPATLATDGMRKEWRWQGMSCPRPLYNLDRLAANPSAPVILVEGEKAADAATILYPGMVATTWCGGGKALNLTDMSPLFGRVVVLSPDNDMPGLTTMLQLACMLSGKSPIWFLQPPANSKKGWDLADYAGDDPAGHFKAHIDPKYFL